MKRKLLLFTLLLLGFALHAQSEEAVEEYSKSLSFSSVSEGQELSSVGFRNSFSISLPTDDRKLAAKVWKTYVSSRFNGRTKYDRKAKEYITPNAMVSPVTSGSVNLVGKPEKFGGSVRFTLWLNEEGTYIKSAVSPSKAREIESILEDYVVQIEKEKVRLQLVEEEKELRKREHKLRRLINANERYHREIELAKERIKKMEENIIQNEQDQITANDDIIEQQEKVKQVKENMNSIN